jgi:hypothetical protein
MMKVFRDAQDFTNIIFMFATTGFAGNVTSIAERKYQMRLKKSNRIE